MEVTGRILGAGTGRGSYTVLEVYLDHVFVGREEFRFGTRIDRTTDAEKRLKELQQDRKQVREMIEHRLHTFREKQEAARIEVKAMERLLDLGA